MTSYRDGYDFRKWHASGLQQRPRRYWVRWGLAGSTLVALVGATLQVKTDLPGLVFATFPAYFVSMSPFAKDSWATDHGRSVYDEFEHAALLHATARAFATYIALVVCLTGWLAVGPPLCWAVPTHPKQWITWLLTLMIVGMSLPATFAKFMVPMPDAEDEPL